jgi:hypothetical protein
VAVTVAVARVPAATAAADVVAAVVAIVPSLEQIFSRGCPHARAGGFGKVLITRRAP